MTRLRGLLLLVCGVAAGAAGATWYARSPAITPSPSLADAPSPVRRVLYYRDPTGAPRWSASPAKHANGRDFLPVYEDEEPAFGPGGEFKKAQAAKAPRRILYYRNPMGLPDTSPAPKKDWMGMDYIPVYDGEEPEDGKTVRVSLDRLQRSGVRTETVEPRVIVRPVRAVGTAKRDDARLIVVTTRTDGFIEELFVNRLGQRVQAGEPLFRIYSPDIVRAQIDLAAMMRATARGAGAPEWERNVRGAMQQLRNLGAPESRIDEVRKSGAAPRTLDWLSPATGDVITKNVVNGQRVRAGDELFRIADHAQLWVIADVAEADLRYLTIGMRASLTFRAYPMQPFDGEVTFIYPELRAETRTARVRIEVPNPDGRLKIDMYADVVFQAGADAAPVIAVPASAVIDSGTRQVVLVARGEGRFEPRAVRLGRRDDGYVEVIDGIKAGEEVVTAATFLIDAESNLKAALQSFTRSELPQ